MLFCNTPASGQGLQLSKPIACDHLALWWGGGPEWMLLSFSFYTGSSLETDKDFSKQFVGFHFRHWNTITSIYTEWILELKWSMITTSHEGTTATRKRPSTGRRRLSRLPIGIVAKKIWENRFGKHEGYFKFAQHSRTNLGPNTKMLKRNGGYCHCIFFPGTGAKCNSTDAFAGNSPHRTWMTMPRTAWKRPRQGFLLWRRLSRSQPMARNVPLWLPRMSHASHQGPTQ